MWKCYICSMIFDSYEELQVHQTENHHSDWIRREYPYLEMDLNPSRRDDKCP